MMFGDVRNRGWWLKYVEITESCQGQYNFPVVAVVGKAICGWPRTNQPKKGGCEQRHRLPAHRATMGNLHRLSWGGPVPNQATKLLPSIKWAVWCGKTPLLIGIFFQKRMVSASTCYFNRFNPGQSAVSDPGWTAPKWDASKSICLCHPPLVW